MVAAAGLQKDGHDVVVYEQREEPSPAGAGLTLFGNAALRLTPGSAMGSMSQQLLSWPKPVA